MCRFSLINPSTVNLCMTKSNENAKNDFLSVKGHDYYRLGWDSYCFFNKNAGGFTLDTVGSIPAKHFDLPSKAVKGIFTLGVSTCTIVMIRIDDQFCFMHLDADPAKNELENHEIIDAFLSKCDKTATEIFIVSSYIESKDNLEISLINEIEKSISEQFNDVHVHINHIKRCTEAQYDNGEIVYHIEIGTAFSDGEAIVYGDAHKSNDANFIKYFEIPLTPTEFTDKDILCNRNSGGCIVM